MCFVFIVGYIATSTYLCHIITAPNKKYIKIINKKTQTNTQPITKSQGSTWLRMALGGYNATVSMAVAICTLRAGIYSLFEKYIMKKNSFADFFGEW